MPKSQIISLVDLNVSTDNYRFEPVKSQNKAIATMIEDQGEFLFNIAKHIVENGLNPGDPVQVTPSEEDTTKYNVLEGNRRIVSLKLLAHPDLIENTERKSLKNKFKALHGEQEAKIIHEVNCLVFDKPEDADKWIKLKHTGPNEGIGTVRWSPGQIDRFEEKVEKKSSLYLQTIDLLKKSKYVPSKLKERLNDAPVSNVERLISDPDVRKFLGLEYSKGKLKSSIAEEEVVKGLTHIMENLLDRKINVNNIYYKENRESYISKFPKSATPNTTIKAEKTWEAPQSDKTTKDNRHRSRGGKRTTVIPSTHSINISNTKVSRIYDELQRLKIKKFKHASSVLLRVFVELSIDCYSKKHNLPLMDKKGKFMKLKDKVKAVVTQLEKNQENVSVCKGVMVEMNKKHGTLGIDTLHAYIHNAHFSPQSSDLIDAWDNIEEFMKIVWENTN